MILILIGALILLEGILSIKQKKDNFLKWQKVAIMIMLASSSAVDAQIKIGDPLPSIILQDTNNRQVNVALVQDKYLLVDFWASWCAPCRMANREMVKLEAQQYTNLVIIEISLDTVKEKWLKALKIDKINYLQLNDPNGFDATTALQFGVEQLPATYLFDTKGKLIAINPTHAEINNLNLK